MSGSKSVKKGQKMLKKATNLTYTWFFEKRVISSICGFFGILLALFDTFTTRYDDLDIKSKFSGYFYPYKHFI